MLKKKKSYLGLIIVSIWLMVSGCSADHASLYAKGIDYFGAGDYLEAAETFEKAGDYMDAKTYATYSRGLVLYEQTLYGEAAPYFEQVQSFMYGKQRYQYSTGRQYEIDGKYAEAAEMFALLTDFEDATVHYHYCTARKYELEGNHEQALYSYMDAGEYADAPSRLANIQWQMYEYAENLMTQGNYEYALSLFSKLGDFRSSVTQMRRCQEVIKQNAYDAASLLQQAGDLQGAYEGFNALIGYSDAQSRVYELETLLGLESTAVHQ